MPHEESQDFPSAFSAMVEARQLDIDAAAERTEAEYEAWRAANEDARHCRQWCWHCDGETPHSVHNDWGCCDSCGATGPRQQCFHPLWEEVDHQAIWDAWPKKK